MERLAYSANGFLRLTSKRVGRPVAPAKWVRNMSGTQHLVQMANDIGNFFRAQQREDALVGIANHIKSFWTPNMRRKLYSQIDHGAPGLDDLPREALCRLQANPLAKPSQPPGGDAG